MGVSWERPASTASILYVTMSEGLRSYVEVQNGRGNVCGQTDFSVKVSLVCGSLEGVYREGKRGDQR